jgi:hypothetical protein
LVDGRLDRWGAITGVAGRAPQPTRIHDGEACLSRSPRQDHAGAGFLHRYPAFPQSARQRKSQSWLNSCAQIATIPMNSVSEASAAASSTKTFSITASFTQEHRRNIVPFSFFGQEAENGEFGRAALKEIAWLMASPCRRITGIRAPERHRGKPIDEERFRAIKDHSKARIFSSM